MPPWTFAPADAPPDPLAPARAGRVVLDDFRPLPDSLDWRLGQEYLRRRGSLAFIADPDPVPFVVNNDGALSVRAAEVVFAALAADAAAGRLGPASGGGEIVVLELGPGVGLFARFFLDRLRQLCDAAGADYYDRLTYVLADRSARMLRDVGRRGVLAAHAGRCRLRLIDARDPAAVLADPDVAAAGPRPLRAVFLNYLLDCLPADALRAGPGGALERLHVRTSVPAGPALRAAAGAPADELARLAALPGAEAFPELLDAYPLCLAEYAYRPCGPADVPLGEFGRARALARGGAPLLHGHGALACLDGLLGLLADGGLILVNDYGTAAGDPADAVEHQRFGFSTFVGVDFGHLAAYFGGRPGVDWVEPDEGDAGVHARLLGRAVAPAAAGRFRECFHHATRAWLEEPAARARGLARAGRCHAAVGAYEEALRRQPFAWPLLAEAAHLLTFTLGAPAAGAAAARRALALNPGCSAELWNALGDALFEAGRAGEARAAFGRALAVNPDDVQGRYNLAFAHTRAGDYGPALVRMGEALGLDRRGAYRERLLQKQAEVLGLLAGREQRLRLGQADRVAGADGGR